MMVSRDEAPERLYLARNAHTLLTSSGFGSS
jgi:hypothetical protein